jgi:hypothetical protein
VTRAAPVPNGGLVSLVDNQRTCQAEVADFIVPNLDGNGEIDISGWERAHHAIISIWEETESTFVVGLLRLTKTRLSILQPTEYGDSGDSLDRKGSESLCSYTVSGTLSSFGFLLVLKR